MQTFLTLCLLCKSFGFRQSRTLSASRHGLYSADQTSNENHKSPQHLLSSVLLSPTATSPFHAADSRLHQHEAPIRRKSWIPVNGAIDQSIANPQLSRYQPLPHMSAEPRGAQKVAVVIGASRGIGKGIALELGAAGYLVYVAGRSTRESGETKERPMGPDTVESTIDKTCDEIIASGGRAIAARCDVQDDSSVSAVFRRVREEQGRLDMVVCSAFSIGDADIVEMKKEFWQQGAKMWDGCHGAGLRGSYVACVEAAPLLIDTAGQGEQQGDRPLIVLVSSFGGRSTTFNVAYGVGKAATDRMAKDMSYELRPYGVDIISLYPGLVRTEGNLELERRGEWAKVSGGLDLNFGETPRYSGRAVVALAARPDLTQARSGDVQVVAELATELGFTDVDGSVPMSIRDIQFLLPNYVFPEIERQSGAKMPNWLKDSIPSYLLPWSVFAGGPPPASPGS